MKLTANFSSRDTTKKLMREARSGALATLMVGSGAPYSSLVNLATAADGSPLLLISTMALHTKNLLSDQRVSLMIEERNEGDPLVGSRVSLMGTAQRSDDAELMRRYLARQPDSAMFSSWPDFGIYKMTVETAHLVAGFGRIVDLKAEKILTVVDDAPRLVNAEKDILEHMNAAGHAKTCRLFATKLLGGRDGEWRCVGVDPEGLELQLDRTALRLTFPKRVRFPGTLRKTLKELADKARQE